MFRMDLVTDVFHSFHVSSTAWFSLFINVVNIFIKFVTPCHVLGKVPIGSQIRCLGFDNTSRALLRSSARRSIRLLSGGFPRVVALLGCFRHLGFYPHQQIRCFRQSWKYFLAVFFFISNIGEHCMYVCMCVCVCACVRVCVRACARARARVCVTTEVLAWSRNHILRF